MSSFDPVNFLNTETNEATSTELIPVPVGEFPAVIKSLKPRVLSDGRAVVDVWYAINDSDVSEETGQAEPLVRQSLWLDLLDNGAMDFSRGKNVQLGRIREALGQNSPGKPWNPGMLIGGVVRVKIAHSIDRRDGTTIQADVKAVSAL